MSCSNQQSFVIGMTQTCSRSDWLPSHLTTSHALLQHLANATPEALVAFFDQIRSLNVAHHIELLRKSHRARPLDVVCFGELFTAPYFASSTEADLPLLRCHASHWRGLAEDAATGPTVRALQAVAVELDTAIVAPIFELDASQSPPCCYNTAVVIDSDGQLLGKYRKNHIPQGANEAGAFVEQLFYQRSDGRSFSWDRATGSTHFGHFPVFKLKKGLTIGVLICYDRHFQGCFSKLAAQGAQLVFCPSITFGHKSQWMWPMEFSVEAVRHRLFVGGSNRIGAEPPWHQAFFGQSFFVGPDGPLDDLHLHPEVLATAIQLETLTQLDPAGWHLQTDSRPEIFQ